MAIERDIGAGERLEPEANVRPAGMHEERRALRSSHLASGTLACPACDAPVLPSDGPLSPLDTLDCPFCDHAEPARGFLSLSTPGRPARVEVRVVRRFA